MMTDSIPSHFILIFGEIIKFLLTKVKSVSPNVQKRIDNTSQSSLASFLVDFFYHILDFLL